MLKIKNWDRQKYFRILESGGLHAAITALHQDARDWEWESFEGAQGYQPEMWKSLEQVRAISRELWEKRLELEDDSSGHGGTGTLSKKA